MKKILIALGALLGIVTAAIIIIGYKANDIVAAYKPQIEGQLGKALGAKVSIDTVSVSVFPFTKLVIKDIKIMNSPGTSSSVSVESLKAGVSLSALLSKKLVVTELQIEQPRVTLVKDSSGVSVPGIKPQSSSSSNQPPAAPTPVTTPAQAGMSLNIQRIVISDGAVTYNDKTSGKSIPITNIELDSGILLAGSEVKIPESTLSLTVSGNNPLSISGHDVVFNKDSGALAISGLKVHTDAGDVTVEGTHATTTGTGNFSVSTAGINLAKVATLTNEISPALSQMKVGGTLGFMLSLGVAPNTPLAITGPIRFNSIAADLSGGLQIRDLKGEVQTKGTTSNLNVGGPNIIMMLQGAPVSITATSTITPSNITLSTLDIKCFGGDIKAPTTLGLGTSQTFSTQASVTNISLAEVSKVFSPGLVEIITGTIAKFDGSFSGPLGGNIASSISGKGKLLFKDGVLKNVNLPGLVLAKITNIPLLEGSLRSYVAPEHQKYLDSKDTSLKQLTADFQIAAGTITLNGLNAQSEAFSLQSDGTIRDNGELNLNSTLTFSPDISGSMGKRSKTIQQMLSLDGLLAIPVMIMGKSPALIVIPDVAKFVQGTGKKLIEDTAGKALDKLFGGGKNGKEDKKSNDASKALKGLLGF